MENLLAVDVSDGGVGVVSQRLHAVGQMLLILLRGQAGRYVRAKVVRCWQEGDGVHMGLEFDRVPPQSGYRLKSSLGFAA